jgi:uncharacterized membrane protein
MKYHVVTVGLFIAAIMFYALGLSGTSPVRNGIGATLLVAGVLCESAFWIRSVRRKRPVP